MNLLAIWPPLWYKQVPYFFEDQKNASTSNSPNLSAKYQWLLAPTLQETNISYLESWWNSFQHLSWLAPSILWKSLIPFITREVNVLRGHYITNQYTMSLWKGQCLFYTHDSWHFSINFDPPPKFGVPLRLTTLVFSQTPTNSLCFKNEQTGAPEKQIPVLWKLGFLHGLRCMNHASAHATIVTFQPGVQRHFFVAVAGVVRNGTKGELRA